MFKQEDLQRRNKKYIKPNGKQKEKEGSRDSIPSLFVWDLFVRLLVH